ncbi:hypothetical protein Tco_0906883 [Tanacetum coccineum]|uniref:Xylulose kinase-1 n=1 Tax=Tanacetum coccineum TaxID=301880 RepID=A0ABQ5CL02_9ASTR
MVSYLKKPKGSEGFHQIVDFINVSHIRYALTENPTIYVSLIKQFWQTATARTLDNGEIELTAIIDGKVKTVTEGSVRRHLQLAYANGPSCLGRTTRQESMVPQPRSPTQTTVANETVHEEKGDSVERAATTATSLDAEQGSGNINRTQSTAIPNDHFPQGIGSGGSPRRQDTILGDRPAQTRFERLSKQSNDPPLSRVNTLVSGEDSMTQQELMVFCTTLSKKEKSLETNLKQTKQIYGAAYNRLIKKVKKLEKIAKSSQARRRVRIVVSDDEDDLEDPSKQWRNRAAIDQDLGISLEVSIAGTTVTTDSVAVSLKSAAKEKGKGKMDESKKVKTKTKLYQEQERHDFEAVVRLQAELKEEERQRIARVYEATSSFNVEEWEDIQARVEADEEVVQRLQVEEREKYTEAEQSRMLAELINQRKRYFAAQRAEERRNKPPTQAQQ